MCSWTYHLKETRLGLLCVDVVRAPPASSSKEYLPKKWFLVKLPYTIYFDENLDSTRLKVKRYPDMLSIYDYIGYTTYLEGRGLNVTNNNLKMYKNCLTLISDVAINVSVCEATAMINTEIVMPEQTHVTNFSQPLHTYTWTHTNTHTQT